ncbi:MAG: ABC transporter family substrate-binding protein [Nakamurella sp.]
MKKTRLAMATSLIAMAAMVLAACGSSPGGAATTTPASAGSSVSSSAPESSTGAAGESSTPSSGAAPSTGTNNDTITEAYEQEWYSYNQETANGNATANANVLNPVFQSFVNIDPTGKQVANTELGTVEKTSDSPLTVKYTFDPKAVWSDGVKIGCADFLLDWAANSGWYNTDGTINKDPHTADPTKFLFQTAATNGWDQTEQPKCSDGDQTITLVYKTPFVDWHVIGGEGMPAHVAAKQAGMTDAQLITAIQGNDVKALTPVAKFWNTGWDLSKDKGLPDAALLVSGGPYMVSAWQPGQSVTLKANPKWWGTPAKTGTIVERFIPQEQQVQALQSGEVDVIEPQPTVDVLASLKAMGNKVTTQVADDFTYEHLDLSVKNAFKNQDLREALFKCMPREQIVDNLIKPVNPKATILESLMLQPLMAGYAELAKSNGFAAYDAMDIAGAKAAYKASGVAQGQKIRVIHITPNDRRDNEVALLKASCDPVGFDIENTGLASDKFGAALSSGDYDAALFAWAGSGLFGSIPSLYLSTGAQNFSGWKGDTTLDGALNKVLVTTDQSQITGLLQTADQQMAKNMWSMPLFAFPGVTAFGTDIQGVQHTAAQTGATWNVQDWVRAGK